MNNKRNSSGKSSESTFTHKKKGADRYLGLFSIIFIIFFLFFLIFYLSHRVISDPSYIPSSSTTSSSSPLARFLGKRDYELNSIENSNEFLRVKKLFEETEKLWNEIVSSHNATLSERTREYARTTRLKMSSLENDSLEKLSLKFTKELEALKRERDSADTIAARCISEKS